MRYLISSFILQKNGDWGVCRDFITTNKIITQNVIIKYEEDYRINHKECRECNVINFNKLGE